MVAKVDNFVRESSTTTGTGNFTLSSVTGFRQFSTAFSTGGTDKFFYSIVHQSADEWEFGTGHLSDSTTLVRDTVIDSTNSDSLVSFSSGDKRVVSDIPAGKYGPSLDLGDDGTFATDRIQEIATDFDRNSALTNPSSDKLLVEPYKIGAPEGYLEPGTLTISNNSTDSDHDIDVTGGAVGVHDFSGNWRVVELADETPAFQIDTTGDDGLINGSSLTADTWYELGVIADSSGSNSPSVVGYTDANRPTASSDLPTGFDLFRAMGTPGRTWWIKTDGSSNILAFHHNGSGVYWTEDTLASFSNLFSDTSPTTDQDVSTDISSQAPPTKSNIHLNATLIKVSSAGAAELGMSSETLGAWEAAHTVIRAPANGENQTGIPIFGIEGQTMHHYASGATSQVTHKKIAWFRAV